MSFLVESLESDGRLVELSRTRKTNGNIFTLLVGKNGTGKTRTLSKIANAYIFGKANEHDSEVITAISSTRYPSRVIALSNSRFDRFPDPYRIPDSQYQTPYYYMGLGGFTASPYSVLTQGCEAFLDIFNDTLKKNVIAEVLDYTGFLPYFNIDFRRVYPGTNSGLDSHERLYIELERNKRNNYRTRDFISEDPSLVRRYEHLELNFKNSRSQNFSVNVAGSSYESMAYYDFVDYAAPLVRAGILKASRLTLFDKKTKNKVLFGHASSGQQCMLLMLLGLAGSITNNSLICIDEPEISLHPKWQGEFMSVLRKATDQYTGCHFIIATHSPQIVSGIRSQDGFVSDLETGVIHDADQYSQKSADYQLVEVFHEPGHKNEYLIRILLVMLSKLSQNKELDLSDLETLAGLQNPMTRIGPTDPVFHLYHQVRTLGKLND